VDTSRHTYEWVMSFVMSHFTHVNESTDMTYSHVWHNSFMCVTWRIDMCTVIWVVSYDTKSRERVVLPRCFTAATHALLQHMHCCNTCTAATDMTWILRHGIP